MTVRCTVGLEHGQYTERQKWDQTISYLFGLDLLFNLCVLTACISVYHMHALGQKRVWDPLELELQMVGIRNWNSRNA